MEVEAEVEEWRTWRRCAEGLTWRVAVREDLPQIERIWETKARFLGVKCSLPDLFASPVVLTLIAEDGTGRVVDGVFLEAVIDVTKIGATARGFRSLGLIQGELAAFLAKRGFRRIMAAMPHHVSERMSGGLTRAQFQRQQLCLWDRELY